MCVTAGTGQFKWSRPNQMKQGVKCIMGPKLAKRPNIKFMYMEISGCLFGSVWFTESISWCHQLSLLKFRYVVCQVMTQFGQDDNM